MYIIYDSDEIKKLQNKYLLLEMDTIKTPVDTFTAHCIIPTDSINVSEMNTLDLLENEHKTLIKHYKSQKWNLCISSIESLKGIFKGEMDSFYDILTTRIEKYKKTKKNDSWSYIIDKTIS